MASQTLAVAANYIQDGLVRGVAEDILSVNDLFAELPYTSYTGQAAIVNREPGNIDSLVATALVGQDLSAGGIYKAATAAPIQVTQRATKIIGDVEMDKLVQAESQSDGVDQTALEISAKAKGIARKFQIGMASGTGTGSDLNSLHSLCDPTQYTTASAGQAISFSLLDELLDLVLAKDGQVDYIMMSPRTFRSYKALLRSQNGTPADWVVNLADGRSTIGYETIPVFKNTFASQTETANGAALTTGALSSVWAGVFDDGSKKIGLTGLYPEGTDVGISVEAVGAMENADAEIWRVKQYTNLALFNRRALARLTSINN